MATYRNPRSLATGRRPTHGTASPIRSCYPYTPASPQPPRLQLQPPENLDQDLAIMRPYSNPLFPNSTPVTRCLPENPTSELALPSLEHLANALHALSATAEGRSRNKHSESARRERGPSCERRSSHRRRSRMPSRDRRPSRDHSGIDPEQPPVHVSAATRAPEAISPKMPMRKLHYVPATPSSSMYSPQPAPLKQFSPAPIKEATPLLTPPSSSSSSPRQAPSSPPRRLCAPAGPEARPLSEVKLLPPVIQLSVPTPPSRTSLPPSVEKPKAVMSKLTRFAFAGREFDGDNAAIKALMTSFDHIVDSLVRLDEDEDYSSEASIE